MCGKGGRDEREREREREKERERQEREKVRARTKILFFSSCSFSRRSLFPCSHATNYRIASKRERQKKRDRNKERDGESQRERENGFTVPSKSVAFFLVSTTCRPNH